MGCGKSKQTLENENTDLDIPAGRLFVGFKKEFKNVNFFKEVEVPGSGGKSVLVAKVDGEYCATGSVCPHRGAPLGRGVFRLGRIRCPWHGACFDLSTGDMEDYPGYDNLPLYHTSTKGDCVFVHVDGNRMPDRYVKPVGYLTDKYSKVVIIGCGAAGYTCAQTLRQEGFGGRIIMITQEKYFPYDRSMLSKFPGADFKHLKIRSVNFYQDHDIEIMVNTRVTKVDMHDHKIYWKGQLRGHELQFDALLISVGLKPRIYMSDVLGCKLKNIVTIQTMEDGQKIMKLAIDSEVVLLGSSFIAMELAESLHRKAKHLHIISRGKAPYGIVLGETTGKAILQHFLSNVNNVTFYCTDDIYRFEGNKKNEVIRVITMKRRIIDTTLVVVAIGALPNTRIFRHTPLRMHPIDHSILVNKYMETNIATIFAAGDCCNFPLYVGARDRANICHWHVACTHGKIAALNMLGKNISVMELIPYYWTNVFGLSIRYIGHGESYDEALIYGSLEYANFCTVYRRRKKFIGACCVGCEPLATELVVSLEIRENWTKALPEAITQRFPGDPFQAETNFGFKFKDDMHVREHDLEQYDVIPRMFDDKVMAKEHKRDMFRKISVHEDEDNMFRDPTRPTIEYKSAMLRREQTDEYIRESGKLGRYERLSRIYINHPDLNDFDLLDKGVGSPPVYDIDDGKLPRRYKEETYDKNYPFSLRYLDKSAIRKELKFKKSQKLALRPQHMVEADKPSNEPDPYLLMDKMLHPKHYKAKRHRVEKPSFNPDERTIVPIKPEQKRRNKHVKVEQKVTESKRLLPGERDKKLPIGVDMMKYRKLKLKPVSSAERDYEKLKKYGVVKTLPIPSAPQKPTKPPKPKPVAKPKPKVYSSTYLHSVTDLKDEQKDDKQEKPKDP